MIWDFYPTSTDLERQLEEAQEVSCIQTLRLETVEDSSGYVGGFPGCSWKF